MEIEKKFTIKHLPDNLENYPCKTMEQGYLCDRPVVRIRKSNHDYILTYKSKIGVVEDSDNTRVCNEVEVMLTKEAYEHLKPKCDGVIIEKKRYLIPYEKWTIELDVFSGAYEGLQIAEVEFESIEEAESFQKPSWFLEDVSMEERYSNRYLAYKGI
ncbi:MAG: CYTH domain-containing protein [Lachnospiraceae bacterium]|nr:CYTH domain-containing protein [Lachnospiraceae bacterium]